MENQIVHSTINIMCGMLRGWVALNFRGTIEFRGIFNQTLKV